MPIPRTRLGPYEVQHLIGSGGMGEVYRARDARLDRTVALKVLLSDESPDPERRRRFLHEAKAASALNHPNIITIYDVGTDGGIDFIAMEFVTGQTLAQSIPATGLEPGLAVRLAQQIAGALAKAHAAGIIHRDLKPANIMITEDGRVKVLDFGVAKSVETGRLTDPESTSTVTQAGLIVGTAAYMSPEQAQGRPVDARSDIFAFGAVFYEMLTARRAFTGATPFSTIAAILHREPPPLEGPAEFQSIVERCLKKDPAERFQSMVEVIEALDTALAAKPTATAERLSSVAVMPFVNLSADKENEYFSDGLAEEIINALTHLPGLKVAGRTSSFWFRGKDVQIAEVGRALKVEHLLEGSVRRAGARVRVTPQLVKVADGFHLWSERYDRDMTDIFAVQDEISQAIAKALELKFSPRALAQHHKPGVPAYEAFLKGRYYLYKNTPEALERGRDNLQQAIALDPDYALAYTQMAYYYNVLAWLGIRTPREAMPLAKAQLLRALQLDASLPEANAGLGVIAALYDYDWKEAERRFGLAMASDPVPSYVRYCYAPYYLLPAGRLNEAVSELERAVEDDPLNVPMRISLGTCLLTAGKYEAAIAELRDILTFDEVAWGAHWKLGECYACMGRWTDARTALEEAYRLAPFYAEVTGLFAGVLKKTGDGARSEELVRQLTASDSIPWKALGLAAFHLICDEPQAAADWLKIRIEEHYGHSLFFILWSPMAASLRASSRWPALARAMNLPAS